MIPNTAGGIHVENLSKTYRGGRVRALDGVSLSVRPGEALGVIGPNGAGKTTLLGCLLGFLRPDSGTIAIDGHAPDDLAVRSMSGYLPERLVMDRWMRGRDFLAHHHRLAGLPAEERPAAVQGLLAGVGLSEAAAATPVRKYSRGMLQRLGVAQALIGRPAYLFLDEPTSGVDPEGVITIRNLIAEHKRAGATVVLNSHQLEQVERVCDRVVFVRAGRVQSVETVVAGAEQARVLRVRFLAGAVVSTGKLAAAATEAGATLESERPPEARFRVADDAGAARLLAALAAAEAPVVEAVPEESGLERLFAGGGS